MGDGGAAQGTKAVQAPDRGAEQRVVSEALGELRRVGVQREHEPQQLERLLVRRAQDDEPVRPLPRLPAAAARKRRLERRAPVGHQVQAIGPAWSDDVLDHRPAPYSCPMGLPDIPGRLRLPAGGAGLRRSLSPLAALQPAARTSVLFHRPTHRERRARNPGDTLISQCDSCAGGSSASSWRRWRRPSRRPSWTSASTTSPSASTRAAGH